MENVIGTVKKSENVKAYMEHISQIIKEKNVTMHPNSYNVPLNALVCKAIKDFITKNFPHEKDKPLHDTIETIVKAILYDMKKYACNPTEDRFVEQFFLIYDKYALNIADEIGNVINTDNYYLSKLFENNCDDVVALMAVVKLKIALSEEIEKDLASLYVTYKLILENEGVL